MRYWGMMVLLVVLLATPVARAGGTSVREITLDIPTYPLGTDDKNPPLWALDIYPYSMQTEFSANRVNAQYRAVVLENDYIRVIILPDVGGRIYAAHDKTNNDFDFIYHNHVIKPGLVALRGAWLSGGIEWNFPTRGHTVNTVSPVQYRVLHGDDGSVTCVVGAREWVRRMRWAVSVVLIMMISLGNIIPSLSDSSANRRTAPARRASADQRSGSRDGRLPRCHQPR